MNLFSSSFVAVIYSLAVVVCLDVDNADTELQSKVLKALQNPRSSNVFHNVKEAEDLVKSRSTRNADLNHKLETVLAKTQELADNLQHLFDKNNGLFHSATGELYENYVKYARKETAKFTLGLENIKENPSTAAPQGVDTMLLIISGVCDTLEIMKKHVEQKLSAMRTHRIDSDIGKKTNTPISVEDGSGDDGAPIPIVVPDGFEDDEGTTPITVPDASGDDEGTTPITVPDASGDDEGTTPITVPDGSGDDWETTPIAVPDESGDDERTTPIAVPDGSGEEPATATTEDTDDYDTAYLETDDTDASTPSSQIDLDSLFDNVTTLAKHFKHSVAKIEQIKEDYFSLTFESLVADELNNLTQIYTVRVKPYYEDMTANGYNESTAEQMLLLHKTLTGLMGNVVQLVKILLGKVDQRRSLSAFTELQAAFVNCSKLYKLTSVKVATVNDQVKRKILQSRLQSVAQAMDKTIKPVIANNSLQFSESGSFVEKAWKIMEATTEEIQVLTKHVTDINVDENVAEQIEIDLKLSRELYTDLAAILAACMHLQPEIEQLLSGYRVSYLQQSIRDNFTSLFRMAKAEFRLVGVKYQSYEGYFHFEAWKELKNLINDGQGIKEKLMSLQKLLEDSYEKLKIPSEKEFLSGVKLFRQVHMLQEEFNNLCEDITELLSNSELLNDTSKNNFNNTFNNINKNLINDIAVKYEKFKKFNASRNFPVNVKGEMEELARNMRQGIGKLQNLEQDITHMNLKMSGKQVDGKAFSSMLDTIAEHIRAYEAERVNVNNQLSSSNLTPTLLHEFKERKEVIELHANKTISIYDQFKDRESSTITDTDWEKIKQVTLDAEIMFNEMETLKDQIEDAITESIKLTESMETDKEIKEVEESIKNKLNTSEPVDVSNMINIQSRIEAEKLDVELTTASSSAGRRPSDQDQRSHRTGEDGDNNQGDSTRTTPDDGTTTLAITTNDDEVQPTGENGTVYILDPAEKANIIKATNDWFDKFKVLEQRVNQTFKENKSRFTDYFRKYFTERRYNIFISMKNLVKTEFDMLVLSEEPLTGKSTLDAVRSLPGQAKHMHTYLVLLEKRMQEQMNVFE